MEIEDLIQQKKDLYSAFLDFIESSDDSKSKFKSLIDILEKKEILNNQKEILLVFEFLSRIADNHHRTSNFFSKLEKIYQYIFQTIQSPISDFMPNMYYLNIRILLFLFKNGFISPDEIFLDDYFKKYKSIQFLDTFSDEKFKCFQYSYYLYPGIKQYIPEQMRKEIENVISTKYHLTIEEFDEKCQIGENDSYICSLIRQDSIEEFISYVNKNNISLMSDINPSIFETNTLLMCKKVSLIKYASFFGSIQIVRYLKYNQVPFEYELWIYAVHSNNPEIIHFFEENLEDSIDENILAESIKCHHNGIANYINDNILEQNRNESDDYNGLDDYCDESIKKSLNFFFYPNKISPIISRPNKKNSKFTISDLIFSLKQISIPSTVTSIGYNAFEGCSSLEQISIPSSITSIKDYSFHGCSSLKQITIPSSVTSIGCNAFEECSSLKQISIPSSVTSIGCNAFEGCTLLEQISIPSTITSIENNTFHGCSSLKQISIPSSVTSIGNYVFIGCSSLEQISIPSSVTSIGDYAFRMCASLKQISIPSSVTSIGHSILKDVKKIIITGDIKIIFSHMFDDSSLIQFSIPSSVTSIESYAFNKCSLLEQISIPSSVNSIGEGSFNECELLKQISIPSSITSIKKKVFSGCSSLLEILIPSSVTFIDEYAFNECSSLKSITIPSSVTSIGKYAFKGCSSLTEISIPSSITSIRDYTFGECSSLTQISIPSSVTSIGNYAFIRCSSLKQISIPSSVTSIGVGSFYGCSSLEQISIPSSVTSIGNDAFRICVSLKQVILPATLTIINDYTFYGCFSLTQITIPLSVISIGKYSFCACSLLNDISIPSSVKIIKSYAFNKCSSIKQIIIPSSVTIIEEGTFSWCTSLKQIEIHSEIKSIEDFLFTGCSSLENIVIPSSVISFGEYSFCSCSSLKEISIPSTMTFIPNFLFSWCYSLTKISIPSSIKSIGDYAFFQCDNLVDVEIPLSVKEVGIDSFTDCFSLNTKFNFTVKENFASSFNIDDYVIEKLICNNHAQTFKAINKNTNEELVIKTYHESYFKNFTGFLKMVDCSRINIPGFARIQNYRFPVSDDIEIKVESSVYCFSYYIVTSSFYKFGDISSITKEYLNSKGVNSKILNPTIRSKIIFGVAAIMKKLHDKNIIHRDLSISKVLLDDNLEPIILPSRYTLILTDQNELEKILFTSYNMAPEMHQNEKIDFDYSFPVDVYAYGIFLYNMFSPELKIGKEKENFRRAIDKGMRPSRPSNIPDHYWELIQICWNHEQSDRPTFDEILDILNDDKYAIEEFGMKTDLNELNEYKKRIEP